MSEQNPLKYFLGSNTPVGFVSRFEQAFDSHRGDRVYILKGGPGTGKSTLMKAVCRAFPGECEEIYCSSDPDSLDGVLMPGRHILIADGTSPHVIEPKYPGASEILVNLGDGFDEDSLYEKRDEIISLTDYNKALHKRATRFLAAAGSLSADTFRMAMDCTDCDKVIRYVRRLMQREFDRGQGSGREKIRVFSAVTPKGMVYHQDTITAQAQRIFAVDDEYGAAGRVLFSTLRHELMEAGYDIVTGYCSLAPFDKIEHIVVPQLGTAFVTSNRWHPFTGEAYRTVHAARFTGDGLKAHRQKIHFNNRAMKELVYEAAYVMQEAKAVHDKLEDCYITSQDFSVVEARTQKLIDAISRQ